MLGFASSTKPARFQDFRPSTNSRLECTHYCLTAAIALLYRLWNFSSLAKGWRAAPGWLEAVDSTTQIGLLYVVPNVGVNLGGGDALVTEQRLDVHPLGPGVREIGGVSMVQLVRADLLVDPGLVQHPPQVGASRLGGHRLLAHRAGE